MLGLCPTIVKRRSAQVGTENRPLCTRSLGAELSMQVAHAGSQASNPTSKSDRRTVGSFETHTSRHELRLGICAGGSKDIRRFTQPDTPLACIRTKTILQGQDSIGFPVFHGVRFSNPVRNTCKTRSALVIARSSSGELLCSTCISVNRRSMAAFVASRQLGNFLSSISKRAASYSRVQTYCFTLAPLSYHHKDELIAQQW